MNDKTLWKNLYQVYADFSDFIEDFNAARDIEGNAHAAVLLELTAAKLELSTATHMAREALSKVSRIFTWNPDEAGGNHE